MLVARQSVRAYLIRNTGVVLIGLFINQVLQTVGSGILARVIATPTLFGEVSVMLQILGMSGLFLNVGLNSSLTYLLSRHGHKAVKVAYSPAWNGSILAGLAVALTIVALAPMLAALYRLPALSLGLMLGSAVLVFNSLTNIGLAAYSGMRQFVAQSILMVVTTLLSTIGMVLGALLDRDHSSILWSVSASMAAAGLGTSLLIAWRVKRSYHPPLLGAIRLRALRAMLRYGMPMWAGNIAKAFQQPFLVMVTGLSSVVAAGYLSNGLKIAGFLNIVTWAFNVVALPFLSEVAQDAPRASLRGTLCFRYNNYILFPLTLMILLHPRAITLALFGRQYVTADSGTYVRLLSLGVLFSSIGRLGGTLLGGMGRTRANFWVMVVSGIVVFVAAPLLIPLNPLLGSFAYMIGWGLSAISLFWFLVRDGLPLHWRRAFLDPLLPSLAAALVALGADFWPSFSWLGLLLAALLVALLTWWTEHSWQGVAFA